MALAFDGSKSLDAWERTREFAQRMQNKGIRVRFSYYINAAYFLANSQKSRYVSPKKGSGASAIGFGGSASDVAARVAQVEKALAEGHEVGSHAVGYFNAADEKWSEADWNQEFSEFNKIMTNVFEFNGLPVRPLGYSTKTFVGFRAPELGVTSGLYPVLKKFGYRYDTSRVASSTYWPEKINGIWNFPLAEIRMAHTGRMTLSMDYNFYVAHSRAQDDLSRVSEFEEDMYQSYMNYFMQNYNGNRAPVHIGHHFSMWNGGAYWRAMARFAESVCGKPEVFCDMYKELADWLDSLPDSVLQAYYRRKGSAASSLGLVFETSGQDLLDTEEILRRGYALPPANAE